VEYTLGWIFAGIVLACVLVSSILLQTRANERIRQLTAELANSRKNENVATTLLSYEKQARVQADAFALSCRDEMAKNAALCEGIGKLVGQLNEQHLDVVSRIMTVLAAIKSTENEAQGDAEADGEPTTEIETELERCAQLGAEAVLDKRPGLLRDENLALGASCGALMTMHSYIKLALHRQLGIADKRLEDGGVLPSESIEPVPDSGRGRVLPFARRTREHEGPPSSNPAPISG
jgi:hypothetical protein